MHSSSSSRKGRRIREREGGGEQRQRNDIKLVEIEVKRLLQLRNRPFYLLPLHSQSI